MTQAILIFIAIYAVLIWDKLYDINENLKDEDE